MQAGGLITAMAQQLLRIQLLADPGLALVESLRIISLCDTRRIYALLIHILDSLFNFEGGIYLGRLFHNLLWIRF